jgi:hypothetical protein
LLDKLPRNDSSIKTVCVSIAIDVARCVCAWVKALTCGVRLAELHAALQAPCRLGQRVIETIELRVELLLILLESFLVIECVRACVRAARGRVCRARSTWCAL